MFSWKSLKNNGQIQARTRLFVVHDLPKNGLNQANCLGRNSGGLAMKLSKYTLPESGASAAIACNRSDASIRIAN